MKILNSLLNILKNIFILIIILYQKHISPFLPKSCRYHPSCSEYSKQAFNKYGIIKGVYLSSLRLLKCNPLFKGGVDELK